jgi:hypothetical protein
MIFEVHVVSIRVGIVTGYTLEGQGSIPGRGKELFSSASRMALWPSQPLIQWVPGSVFPEIWRPGLEADHTSI